MISNRLKNSSSSSKFTVTFFLATTLIFIVVTPKLSQAAPENLPSTPAGFFTSDSDSDDTHPGKFPFAPVTLPKHLLPLPVPIRSKPPPPPLPPQSLKSFKTPGGTVKCSCQTVDDTDNDQGQGQAQSLSINGSNASLNNDNLEPGKTFEIEIYKPIDDDVVDEPPEPEVKVDPKMNSFQLRNSFTLDGDANDDHEDDLRNSGQLEEENPFLSFLNSMVAVNLSNSGENNEKIRDHPNQNDNHRMFDVSTEPSTAQVEATERSTIATIYKAFQSSELGDSVMSLFASTEQDDRDFDHDHDRHHDEKNSRDDMSTNDSGNIPHFPWDVIYGHKIDDGGSIEKKREFLYLGSLEDSFRGPRRRRRSRNLEEARMNKGHRARGRVKKNKMSTTTESVTFIYPVGQEPKTEKNNVNIVPVESLPLPSKMESRSDEVNLEPDLQDRSKITQAMQQAMRQAWQNYGPGGTYSYSPEIRQPEVEVTKVNPLPAHVLSTLPPQVPKPSPPPPLQEVQESKMISQYAPSSSPPPLPLPQPPNPGDRYFTGPQVRFQPMTSEWDKRVVMGYISPVQREPSMFSKFLSRYIDFEVNHHETADLTRKAVFSIFVGALIVAWLILGLFLGILPPYRQWFGQRSDYWVGSSRRSDDGSFRTRDLAETTDKILLALEVDWLRKLEERVMGAGRDVGGGKKPQTQVFCCILPDKETQGMVECQATRKSYPKGKKRLPVFKCVSNLIYNFQFGPKDDSGEIEESDFINTVDSKSKNAVLAALKNETEVSQVKPETVFVDFGTKL